MIKYVNGYGKPIFVIRDPVTKAIIEVITFPQTLMPDGLMETHREDSTYVILTKINSTAGNVSKRKVKTINGWESSFYFDYNAYADNDTIINKVKKVQDYETDGKIIDLVPRADNPSRRFQVMQVPGSEIVVQILGGGARSIGNRSLNLNYITVNLSKYLPISDPNNIQYAVMHDSPRIVII